MKFETKQSLLAGLPVIDEYGKTIGIVNSDGSITITDIDFINEVINKKSKIASMSFKEGKS